jgi:hypothetical protein
VTTKQCLLCMQEGHHYNECRLFYQTLCDGLGVPAILNTPEQTRSDRQEVARIHANAGGSK